MADKLIIEVLEDGTIKTTTDAVSAANHANAEGFLRQMATLAGGKSERTRRHGHGHHAHTHEHDDEHHTH